MALFETKRTYVHTPTSRRFFWWFLFVSYFIVTGTVLFFTLGYRFNFATNIFVHTGSLNVKSEPQDVTVRIDGKEPARRHLNFINGSYHITGIGHGPHELEFSAEGYKTWRDNIVIRSGRATEFWNVVLVKEFYDRTAYDVVNPGALFFAPGNELLAYPEDSGSGTILTIANLKDNHIENLAHLTDARFAAERENIEWAPRQDKLIVPVERTVVIPDFEIADAGIFADEEGAEVAASLSEDSVDPIEDGSDATDGELGSSEGLLTEEVDADNDEGASILDTPEKDYLIAVRDDNVGFTFTYLGSILKSIFEREEKAQEDLERVAEDAISVTAGTSASEVEQEIDVESEQYKLPRISHVRWLPNEQDVLYAILDGTLTRIDISSFVEYKTESLMDDVVAYDFADDGIYILTKAGTLFRDNNHEANDPFVVTHLADVDDQLTHRLTAYDKERVFHIANETGIMSLYNKKGNTVVTRALNADVVDARFSDDGKKLMYHTKNDIYVYFTRVWDSQPFRAADTINHIFRFDTPLETVEWLPDYEHLIAASDGRIQLLDLDQRGDHNLTEITTHTPADGDVVMDANNDFIYFTDRSGDELRLQSIEFPGE